MSKSKEVVCLLLDQPHPSMAEHLKLCRHEDLHNRKKCYAPVAKIMVRTVGNH